MVRCTRCGHPYENHRIGRELKCRMRIAMDWDEKTKAFLKTAPCLCPGYRGERGGWRDCPHEYVKTRPACVHCGHVKVKAV